jgi:hypothetical protein
MNSLKSILFLLLATFLFGLASCNLLSGDKDVIAAKVYDFVLTEEALVQSIPSGLTPEDSVRVRTEYIQQWIREHVLLHQAIENDLQLPEEVQSIEKQVEDYRNSLIIYQYTKKLVEQKLDTNVSEDEVEKYYRSHANDFVLKDDIIKILYLKLEKNARNIGIARSLLRDYKASNYIKLEAIAEDRASNFFLDTSSWILFEDILKEIPLEIYNRSLYLQNNKYVEVEDSIYIYMLRVNAYRVQDGLSPLSFESERIRDLIVNGRKMLMIEQMKESIYKEAIENNKIKIFEK